MEGYDFYREVLGSPRYVVAPMVDMSELAWRQLSRENGAQLCYTPMFHSPHFADSATYRKDNFHTNPEDRPLIVQFCGNDPQTVLKAAKYVEDHCDAVDLNLGCPQGIARRGHYGAFLQDEWDLISSIVSLLHKELSVPVTCKIRVFKEVERTIAYAKMMENAGCQLLTIHGRTREMKGPHTGIADWEHIRAVRQAIKIPMFANGNILYFEDIERCIAATGVDGVMTAETNLYNPALFTGKNPPVWVMVDRYLEIAQKQNTGFQHVKGHVFKLYNISFQIKHHLRDLMAKVHKVQDVVDAQQIIKAELIEDSKKEIPDIQVQRVETCANFKHLPHWVCQPYFRSTRLEAIAGDTKEVETDMEAVLQAERKARKEQKRLRKAALFQKALLKPAKKRKFASCTSCEQNPGSEKCVHKMCKRCCLSKTIELIVDCEQHNVWAKARHERMYGTKSKDETEKEDPIATV